MLSRLRVVGFKSLRDVEVSLGPIVVVFGPNAVGKSNLLEAMLLLSRSATARTVAEAFAAPLRGYPMEAFTLPSGGLPELLSRQEVKLRLEADLEVDAGENGKRDTLRYAVGIRGRPRTGELVVCDEYLVRLKRDGTPKAKPRIEPVDGHLVVRRLGEAGQPRQEELGLNHTLVSNLQFSGEHRYPDFDHLRAEVRAWRSYYLDPASAMRSAQPPRDVNDIGTAGELIAPFLYRLRGDDKHRRHFESIARALKTAIPAIDGLAVDLDKERGTLDVRITQHGVEYSSRVISEGTLRVLALCAIAANPWRSSLVAFEEPENGVHPRRIEVIADLLFALGAHTQLVITTHSPTLVAAMLRKHRQAPEKVLLLRCVQDGTATHLKAFEDPLPMFEKAQIEEALRGTEDEQLVQGLLVRGWLDG
jgi:predicted ATPase